MDMSKVKDRRMVAALGFLTRSNVGYVGMVAGLCDEAKEEIAKLYPDQTDAEAFVLLSIQFANDFLGRFENYVSQQLYLKTKRGW